MAIKDIIGAGVGFSPGSVKFIITRGLGTAVAAGESRIGEKWKASVRRRQIKRRRK